MNGRTAKLLRRFVALAPMPLAKRGQRPAGMNRAAKRDWRRTPHPERAGKRRAMTLAVRRAAEGGA